MLVRFQGPRFIRERHLIHRRVYSKNELVAVTSSVFHEDDDFQIGSCAKSRPIKAHKVIFQTD